MRFASVCVPSPYFLKYTYSKMVDWSASDDYGMGSGIFIHGSDDHDRGIYLLEEAGSTVDPIKYYPGSNSGGEAKNRGRTNDWNNHIEDRNQITRPVERRSNERFANGSMPPADRDERPKQGRLIPFPRRRPPVYNKEHFTASTEEFKQIIYMLLFIIVVLMAIEAVVCVKTLSIIKKIATKTRSSAT